jgi:hypothetical protein
VRPGQLDQRGSIRLVEDIPWVPLLPSGKHLGKGFGMAEAGQQPERDCEMLRLYWQVQWDRIGRLEDQRLQYSNFVIAASVVTIGLSVTAEGVRPWTLSLVAMSVMVANLLAALYSLQSEKWVQMHRRRSDLILEENWNYITDLRARAGRPVKPLVPYGHTSRLQPGLHILLTLTIFLIFITGLGN